MSAVADARGLKRVCADCGSRFYDLNKRPVVCPGCKTEFTGEIKTKARRGRAAVEEGPTKKELEALEAKKKAALAEEQIDSDDNVVSLSTLEEDSAGSVDGDDDTIPLDDGDLDDLGAGIESMDDDDDDDLSADIDIQQDEKDA